jgi:hypothetical protein
MSKIPWLELKEKLLNLSKACEPITVERLGVIIDEEIFLKSHIAVIDQYPKKENLSHKEMSARLYIAKPHYDRLLAYFIMKTQLSGAF